MISNCDIGLHSVNMIDTIIDVDRYKASDSEQSKKKMVDFLNNVSLNDGSKGRVTYELDSVWSKTRGTINSAGSVKVTRGSVYLIYGHLCEAEITLTSCKELDKNLFEQGTQNELSFENQYKEIRQFLKAPLLTIERPEMKLGVFGEVLFFAKVPIRNEYLSGHEYKKICEFLFRFTREYYMDIAILVSNAIVQYFLSCETNKDKSLRLLETFYSKIILKDSKFSSEEVARRCFHSFTWSHFLYCKDVSCQEDIVSAFQTELEYEVLDNSVYTSFYNSYSYLTWSNAIFIACDLPRERWEEFITFYKTPIEIEWAEWEFIRNLNKKVEWALFDAYDKLENKKIIRKGISKLGNRVDKFYFFSRRVIEYFDGISLTVNPIQLELVERQRRIWKLDVAKENYLEKLGSLYEIIIFLREKKKESSAKVLNGILFIIALLSIIDISNTVYNILLSNNNEYIYFTLMPASSVFIITLLVFRVMKD